MEYSKILVTGATGFIGAHVVENLLSRGIHVRAAARSKSKGHALLDSHPPSIRTLLEVVYIADLAAPGVFDTAVQGVDAVIHVASPLDYSVKNKEKELIIPAINGVRSLFQAAARGNVKRIVLTSSFGAVLDMTRPFETAYTYTSADWNPITYAEAVDSNATPQDAYRGSKKFAEQEAWRFIREEKPKFDLVVMCPSMVFGPVAGKLASVDGLGESDRMLWKVVSGGELPPARFNFWVDVRDLAECHVRALVTREAGGKRYLPMPEEKFSYQRAREIIRINKFDELLLNEEGYSEELAKAGFVKRYDQKV
ncbi:hypothetical protein B7463_g3966, partial [Scytalidium lignicola]